jgi:hypothetical protein
MVNKDFAFCILHFAFCILHFAFCILHFAFFTLHFAFCIIHFAFCIIHLSFCILSINENTKDRRAVTSFSYIVWVRFIIVPGRVFQHKPAAFAK